MDRSATQISLTLCDLVFPSPKCCKFSVLLWACVCVCVCRVIVVVSLIRPTRSFSQLYWAFQVFLVAREVQTKNWLNYVKHPQWHLFWLCICVSVYLCICVSVCNAWVLWGESSWLEFLWNLFTRCALGATTSFTPATHIIPRHE